MACSAKVGVSKFGFEGPARGGPSRAFRWCRKHGGGLLLKGSSCWSQKVNGIKFAGEYNPDTTPSQESFMICHSVWQCSPCSLHASEQLKDDQLRMCQPMEREDPHEVAEQLHSLVELRSDEHSLRCWLHVLTFINFQWFWCLNKLTSTDINRCHTISVIVFSSLSFVFQTPAVAACQVDGMESGDSEDVTELDVLEQRWKVFADFELYKSFLAIESTKKVSKFRFR